MFTLLSVTLCKIQNSRHMLQKSRLGILGAIIVVISVFSCKKNDVNFDKFNNSKIKPEVLTPLANVRIVAGDILKQDSIIKYDPDGLIRLTFKQDSVFVMGADSILKNVSLGKSASRFSIGALTIAGVEEKSIIELNDFVSGATQDEKDLLNFMNGKKDTFPAISSKKEEITAIKEIESYEYLKISSGYMILRVLNGLPTELKSLKINLFDSIKSSNPVLLGTLNLKNIQPNMESSDSINIGNRYLGNALGFTITEALIEKSKDSVLINLEDKIDITVSINNVKCIGGKAQIPNQLISTRFAEINLDSFLGDKKITNVIFDKAQLPVKISTNFKSQLIVNINSSNFSRNGNSIPDLGFNINYSEDIQILNLDDARIDLTSDLQHPYNRFNVNVTTTASNSKNIVEFDSSDWFQFEIDANSASIAYLDGYLGSDTFDINIDGLDVSQLAELGKGIRMEDPKMRIYVNNSFGIPILVELDITSRDENGNELPMNVQDMAFPYPSIAERGTVKSETFEINKNNSDIVNCLGMPAVAFDIKGRAIMNPDGFTGFTNHLTNTSAIDLGFDADIPMTFTAKNFAFVDTLDRGSSLQGLADFDLLELKIKTINGFPLGGTLDLIFTDSAYNRIDSLMNVTLLESAVVDNNGKITANSENMSTFLMNAEMLDKLDSKKSYYILLRTNFNSYDNGNVPVSIYTSCALDVSLAFRAIYDGSL